MDQRADGRPVSRRVESRNPRATNSVANSATARGSGARAWRHHLLGGSGGRDRNACGSRVDRRGIHGINRLRGRTRRVEVVIMRIPWLALAASFVLPLTLSAQQAPPTQPSAAPTPDPEPL